METLETGSEKIQKICDAIRKETLQPAEKEAERIIEEAKERAKKIVLDAEREAEKELQQARENMAKERNVFESSLSQASKQAIEALRQEIDKKLFQPNLKELVREQSAGKEPIAKLITALIEAIEKEGIQANLTAYVPSSASPKEINALLGEKIVKQLQGHEVVLGDFFGGAKVRVKENNLVCDMSDQAIYELLVRYIHNELRKFFFKTN